MTQTLRTALRSVVAASAAPYGYTISIWGSGALLLSHHGVPDTTDVAAFIAGAIIAFGTLALIAGRAGAGAVEPAHHAEDRILAGTLHWLATGAATTAAALISALHTPIAWPLTSFAATSVYIVGAGIQLAAVAAGRRRGRG